MCGIVIYSPTLYRMFCAATGYGGTTQRVLSDSETISPKTVTVEFDSNVAPGLPWRFEPLQRNVTVHLGEQKLVFSLQTRYPSARAFVEILLKGSSKVTREELAQIPRQRHFTPSCEGHAPTAERTVGPPLAVPGCRARLHAAIGSALAVALHDATRAWSNVCGDLPMLIAERLPRLQI